MFGVGLRFYEPSTSAPDQSSSNSVDQTSSPDQRPGTQDDLTFEPTPEQIAWRGQALEALEDLMERLRPLEEKGVKVWAPEEYQRLLETVTAGEQHYSGQMFREARDEYGYALLQVGALERKVEPTFETNLGQGQQFISDKNYGEAMAPLEIARLIDPGNEDVAAAINTAQNGEAVDRLIVKATFSIEEGRPSEALPFLQEASSLDKTRADVRELAEDARNLSRQMTIRDSIQDGYSSLQGRDFSTAIRLFNQALSLNPKNEDALTALDLAKKQKLEYDLGLLEQSASAAMAAENWTQAIQHYRDALDLRPDTAFAEAGLAQATFFNEKQSQLSELLAKPDRLADTAVAAYATKILQALETTELPPQMAKANAELVQALSAYSTPVQVTLVSDNRSRISLLRRESFSPFRTKTLQLRPGQYTLVARRDGYRDKRITFTVPVRGSAISITIGVDEKL